MRTKLRILCLALITLAIVLIVSCGPPPVSVTDRITMFVADINTNPGNAYADCDTNATDYNASKASSFWTSLFPFTPYAGTVNNSSNTAAVSVTLAGTGGGGVYTFAMVNNKNLGSDNWVISKITDPSSTVIFQ